MFQDRHEVFRVACRDKKTAGCEPHLIALVIEQFQQGFVPDAKIAGPRKPQQRSDLGRGVLKLITNHVKYSIDVLAGSSKGSSEQLVQVRSKHFV